MTRVIEVKDNLERGMLVAIKKVIKEEQAAIQPKLGKTVREVRLLSKMRLASILASIPSLVTESEENKSLVR